LKLTLKIVEGHIADAQFKTLGCEAAIAASSLLTEMIKGKGLLEARAITPEMITTALGGLPKVKLHASALVEEGLKRALDEYARRS
jgi:NifU-like protein involved in Fe-S cluster formation